MPGNWRRTVVAVILLGWLSGIGACSHQDQAPKEGALLEVFLGNRSILSQRADVCDPNVTFSDTVKLGQVYAHVKRLAGGQCAVVTFRCGRNSPEGPEVKMCLGGPPVPTGCSAPSGQGISVQVVDIYRK